MRFFSAIITSEPNPEIEYLFILATQAQYSILQWASLGARPKNIGVLLYDPMSNVLRWKFVEDWTAITSDPDDQEYLALWSAEIVNRVAESGPEAFLNALETTLSNAVLITDRETIIVRDFEAELEALFQQRVQFGGHIRHRGRTAS